MAGAILTGRPGSPGVGSGWALVLPGEGASVGAARSASGAARSVEDPAAEAARLDQALAQAAADLDALADRTTARAGEEVGSIFQAQALFARDPGITGPAHAAITEGAPADEAIVRATDAQAEVLAAVDDAYFRERAADVRDVGRRVAGLLRGDAPPDPWHADGRPAVLVADDLDPSLVATMRPELVAGIALAGGAPTGHAAIVARALGIPMVLGLGAQADALTDGQAATVDGDGGRVLVDPSAEDVAGLASVVPVVEGAATARPHGIAIAANVASVGETEAAMRAGADGIGLVRTELLFLGRTTPPSVAEQTATYRAIAAAAGSRPVVFRTLDVGGDKPAAWRTGGTEANPALGVRGVRLGLRQPDLLDDQLTALLGAVPDGDLRVMLPMVSTTGELASVRARLDDLAAAMRADGRPCAATVRLGIMVEVPAAALMADVLARDADFFSIGTNDLVQYVLAADRTNPELSDLASALQPSVLRLVAGVVRAAVAAGRHVAVCGEAAGDPSVIPLLVGLGVEELSVAPAAVARVREAVARMDPAGARDLAARALDASSLQEVEAIVRGAAVRPGDAAVV